MSVISPGPRTFSPEVAEGSSAWKFVFSGLTPIAIFPECFSDLEVRPVIFLPLKSMLVVSELDSATFPIKMFD